MPLRYAAPSVGKSFMLVDPPSLEDLHKSARKHWFKAAVCATGVLAFSTFVILLLPRTYVSEAKLFVKLGRESVTLDPTATTGQLISINESRENEINSLLELLRSRQIAAATVEALTPEVVLGYRAPPEVPSLELAKLDSLPSESSAIESKIQQSKSFQLATQKIEKSVEIVSPKRSSVVNIICKAESPELAQAIVTTVLNAFREQHVRANQTKGSFDFFVRQEKVLQDQWRAATDALRNAKNRIGTSSIEATRASLQNQLADAESRILAVASEAAASKAKITAIEATIAALPAQMLTQEIESPSAAVDTMRGSLYQVEMRQTEFLSKLQDEHPLSLALREQIDGLKEILQLEQPKRVQTTTAVNPSRQALELAKLTEEANLTSHESRLNTAIDQRGELVNKLREMNGYEIELLDLQRHVDITAQSYREVAGKLEQARLHRELESQKISNVNVVQHASYVSKAIAPKRSLLFAAAVPFALLSGAAVIVVMAIFGRRFRSVVQIKDALGIPVSGLFNDLHPPASIAAFASQASFSS